jgi:hypothetical protein
MYANIYLVFEDPVGLQLWTIFGATATATGCQLRHLSTTATATGCQLRHLSTTATATGPNQTSIVTGCNWFKLVAAGYNQL